MKKIFEKLNIEVDIRTSDEISFKKCESYINLYYGKTLSFTIRNNSSVDAWDNSSVDAWDNSSVVAYHNSSVVARDNSSVVAYHNSSVVARDNSSVDAWDNSSVDAYHNSSVVARDNSSVDARGFSFIRKLSLKVKINKKSDYVTEVSAIRKFKKDTTVFKKVITYNGEYIIAELKCLKGQEFQSKQGNKCRTSNAEVIAFYDYENNKLDNKIARSCYDIEFEYKKGSVVTADYCKDVEECESGIHFYLTFEEAINH